MRQAQEAGSGRPSWRDLEPSSCSSSANWKTRQLPACAAMSRSRSRDPKRRIVSAAPFRDRVVHHALCAVIEPLFERGFIDDSYANRTGKGSHHGRRPL